MNSWSIKHRVYHHYLIIKLSNPPHKTQWKSKLSLLQNNYLDSIHLGVAKVKLIFVGKKI